MILPSDSVLRNPPKRLAPKQVAALNAIQYGADICSVSYQRLIKKLGEVTEKTWRIDYFDFPEIFCEVWSIINHSVLLKKILCKHFGVPADHSYLLEIRKAEGLRNTHQHIEDRIDEVLTTEDLPVYGALSWLTSLRKDQDEVFSLIYSGAVTNKRHIGVTLSNQRDDNEDSSIQRLEFIGVVRKKHQNKKWFFEEDRLLLNKVIYDLTEIMALLETTLREKFPSLEEEETHVSDLIVQLKGERVWLNKD